MTEQLYPKPESPKSDHSDRPWGIKFDLIYDGGSDKWTQYYRTKIGARISAWWKYHISSWGGSANLFDNRR